MKYIEVIAGWTAIVAFSTIFALALAGGF